ncbi:unnamed protein product [Phytomonas sp. Hart1]|nr:unnamed protein product [Phytomonas sp. Hart1]|eukprot:CCW72203.1 unnamed protein product [Phytomonas sp. isolate Hart1]
MIVLRATHLATPLCNLNLPSTVAKGDYRAVADAFREIFYRDYCLTSVWKLSVLYDYGLDPKTGCSVNTADSVSRTNFGVRVMGSVYRLSIMSDIDYRFIFEIPISLKDGLFVEPSYIPYPTYGLISDFEPKVRVNNKNLEVQTGPLERSFVVHLYLMDVYVPVCETVDNPVDLYDDEIRERFKLIHFEEARRLAFPRRFSRDRDSGLDPKVKLLTRYRPRIIQYEKCYFQKKSKYQSVTRTFQLPFVFGMNRYAGNPSAYCTLFRVRGTSEIEIVGPSRQLFFLAYSEFIDKSTSSDVLPPKLSISYSWQARATLKFKMHHSYGFNYGLNTSVALGAYDPYRGYANPYFNGLLGILTGQQSKNKDAYVQVMTILKKYHIDGEALTEEEINYLQSYFEDEMGVDYGPEEERETKVDSSGAPLMLEGTDKNDNEESSEFSDDGDKGPDDGGNGECWGGCGNGITKIDNSPLKKIKDRYRDAKATIESLQKKYNDILKAMQSQYDKIENSKLIKFQKISGAIENRHTETQQLLIQWRDEHAKRRSDVIGEVRKKIQNDVSAGKFQVYASDVIEDDNVKGWKPMLVVNRIRYFGSSVTLIPWKYRSELTPTILDIEYNTGLNNHTGELYLYQPYVSVGMYMYNLLVPTDNDRKADEPAPYVISSQTILMYASIQVAFYKQRASKEGSYYIYDPDSYHMTLPKLYLYDPPKANAVDQTYMSGVIPYLQYRRFLFIFFLEPKKAPSATSDKDVLRLHNHVSYSHVPSVVTGSKLKDNY